MTGPTSQSDHILDPSLDTNIMAPLEHNTLNATLTGVETGCMTHYRGIPYATIKERFTEPVLKGEWAGENVDCTRFG